jgi:hypothetical protein
LEDFIEHKECAISKVVFLYKLKEDEHWVSRRAPGKYSKEVEGLRSFGVLSQFESSEEIEQRVNREGLIPSSKAQERYIKRKRKIPRYGIAGGVQRSKIFEHLEIFNFGGSQNIRRSNNNVE